MKSQSKKQNTEELITIGQAVKRLGVHIDTLRNWDKSGQLKSIRINNKGWRRYRKSDIEKLINND